jgi:hypothetical protein
MDYNVLSSNVARFEIGDTFIERRDDFILAVVFLSTLSCK